MNLQNRLKELLLERNNGVVKFGLDTEKELQSMLDKGRFKNIQGLKVYKKGMLPNKCHRNSAVLKLNKKSYKIETGYALTEDNVWLSHSWLTNGVNIIETTLPFRVYFGYELKGEEEKTFISENY